MTGSVARRVGKGKMGLSGTGSETRAETDPETPTFTDSVPDELVEALPEIESEQGMPYLLIPH
jgi:hypothetical protein